MGTRRQARESALQILFQWGIHGNTDHWLEVFWEQRRMSPDIRDFTERLVEGVMAHCQELDAMIQAQALNWTLNRMPMVDLNILRMSLYELIWEPEIPAKVTLNEALELAKTFADEEARRFVNGILDSVLKEDPRLEAKRSELAAHVEGVKREV